MSGFCLHALKSRHGDCLFLRTGRTTILVDGGPGGVYRQFLKPGIEAIQTESCSKYPFAIDLLLVSHIDEDHVLGLIDLLDDMLKRKSAQQSPRVSIHSAWFNCFADTLARLVRENADRIERDAQRVAAQAQKSLSISLGLDNSLDVISSVSQGRRLRQALDLLKIPVNLPFDNGLVTNENGNQAHVIGDVTVRIIGPGARQLEELRGSWKKILPDILDPARGKAATAVAAARLDQSLFDLASIAVIAENRGSRMLLTGDARGDIIMDWLKEQDELDATGRAHFDVLKLPRHGSTRNIPDGFFRTITADHYVISGNGRFGNPNPGVLCMLFEERGLEEPYRIHLTYGIEEMAARKDFNKDAMQRVLMRFQGASQRISAPQDGKNMISIDI